MTVQDATRAATVPRQARPAGPPPAPAGQPASAAPALLGRDRPLTADEHEFLVTGLGLWLFLSTFIVVFLLLSVHVWS